MLLALPLIALPVLIHLINQRRHRTVEWGAMQFLLSAKKMSKGMARLKHWLIMTARMLAIAGLLLAIARPLATGWFGALTGGKPETVIVILDRSASMQQQQLTTGDTKLYSGLNKIAAMVTAIDSSKRIVLIESTENKPVEIDSPTALLDYPKTNGTDGTSDISEMMQTALEYISDNQTGRTDVWICSDARQNDWDNESTKWDSLKSGFSELDGIRFHVLNYGEQPIENMSVVVDSAERVTTADGVELVLDVSVKRTSDYQGADDVRLEFTINGSRSVLNVRMENEEYALVGHRIALDAGVEKGWGKVELPADTNASDNSFYFTFAEQPPFVTVIVSDSPTAVRSLKLVGEANNDKDRTYSAKVLGTDQLGEINWGETAMLLWHAPLPKDIAAKQVMNFVNDGRTVIFFPPTDIDDTEFNGVSWGGWEKINDVQSQVVGFWRSDDDILQRTRNGMALPVNELKIYQYCSLNGDSRALAKLENGSPLLARKSTDTGGVYFFSTLPGGTHSSLERNGIVIFAMLHRALNAGASSIGQAKQLVSGTQPAKQVTKLSPLSNVGDSLLESRPYMSGVFGNEEQLIALNRPSVEDSAPTLPNADVDKIFDGLDYHIIDDKLGNVKSLASEVWKTFIVLMGLALLLEVILCLPPKPVPKEVELGGATT